MALVDNVRNSPNLAALEVWLQKVPYAVFLGIKAELNKGDILFILPEDKRLIGNPSQHG
jgi:hypothetical protein